jgi:hypothetical protein
MVPTGHERVLSAYRIKERTRVIEEWLEVMSGNG